MRITSTVKIDNRFGELTRGYDRAVRVALIRSVIVGAKVASARAKERSETGTMAQMSLRYPRPMKGGATRGYEAQFYSNAYYSSFQEFGTLGSRKRKLSAATVRRRSSASGQARQAKVSGRTGIQPLKFMVAGRAAARKTLLLELQRRL